MPVLPENYDGAVYRRYCNVYLVIHSGDCLMTGICNFGETDFAKKVPFPCEPEISAIESIADVDLFYRNYKMSVKMDAMYNPTLQYKIENLSDIYSNEELRLSINDLEWQVHSAKESYYKVLCDVKDGEDESNLKVAKYRLDEVLIKLVMLELAFEKQAQQENEGGCE